MPDAGKLPRMGRAVVPLVLRRPAFFVVELIPDRLPRGAAVIRSLDDLAEPAARLGCIEPVWIRRRSFQVIQLPAAEVRTAHSPALALAIGGENERALARANQYSDTTHW